MKHLNYLILALSILGTSHAFAAKERGGGDILVCTTGVGTTYELLDLYEARTRGWTVDLGDPSLSVDQKLELALNRFETRVYDMGFLKSHVASFKDVSNYMPGVSLVNIEDSKHIAVPKLCHLEQGAIQKDPTLAGEVLYNIDQDLWSKLDSSSQAALILHEVIYKYHRDEGATDSVKSRFLVGLIASKDILKLDIPTLVSYLRSVNYGRYREGNMFYSEYSLGFLDNGTKYSTIGCIGPNEYVIKTAKFDVGVNCPSKQPYLFDTMVTIYNKSTGAELLASELNVNSLTIIDKVTGARSQPYSRVSIDINGNLKGINSVYPSNDKVFLIQGQSVCLNGVSYYPSTKIYAGALCPLTSVTLKDAKGKKRQVYKSFYLDESGALTKWDI